MKKIISQNIEKWAQYLSSIWPTVSSALQISTDRARHGRIMWNAPYWAVGKMNQSNYWDMVLFTHCQIKTVAVLHSHTPNRDIYFVGWTTLSMAIKYIISQLLNWDSLRVRLRTVGSGIKANQLPTHPTYHLLARNGNLDKAVAVHLFAVTKCTKHDLCR